MVLKDSLICSCGNHMFPFEFDSDEKIITYKCTACGSSITKDFSDVSLQNNEQPKYFVLDESGEITWKCPTHGYCAFTIDSFTNGLYEMCGFEKMRCPICYYESCEEDDNEANENEKNTLEYAQSEDAKNDIRAILDNLTEEQQRELVGQYEVDPDDFGGHYPEALRMIFLYFYCDSDAPFESYLEELKQQIYDLFEIDLP